MGVILMVAITVILAAIVASFVFGTREISIKQFSSALTQKELINLTSN